MILQCVCDCLVDCLCEVGIVDEFILNVIWVVSWYLFIDEVLVLCVYEDIVLLIGYGQIILQFWVVVWMIEVVFQVVLKCVLEVGIGLGYQVVILGVLGLEVYIVECIGDLLWQVCKCFCVLGMNICIKYDDGCVGWVEYGLFDVIVVIVVVFVLVDELVGQLVEGGCLVVLVGGLGGQLLVQLDCKFDGGIEQCVLVLVMFVLLLFGMFD